MLANLFLGRLTGFLAVSSLAPGGMSVGSTCAKREGERERERKGERKRGGEKGRERERGGGKRERRGEETTISKQSSVKVSSV